MKLEQTYKFKEDKKHSVIYVPKNETPDEPAIASSVYISRLVLPKGRMVPEVTLTLDIAEGGAK